MVYFLVRILIYLNWSSDVIALTLSSVLLLPPWQLNTTIDRVDKILKIKANILQFPSKNFNLMIFYSYKTTGKKHCKIKKKLLHKTAKFNHVSYTTSTVSFWRWRGPQGKCAKICNIYRKQISLPDRVAVAKFVAVKGPYYLDESFKD